MSLLVFDIGGTSVKFALWNNGLSRQSSFNTPSTWDEMKSSLLEVFNRLNDNHLTGVAISSPGSVNRETGVIAGISAIDYIHDFPIRKELSELFLLPVSIENDANSAALAELWKGKARSVDHALFVVIGTGIGGAIIQDRKLVRGKNLFAGEFGIMMLNETTSFSMGGTAVHMAERYCDRLGVPHGSYSGKDVFKLALEGDANAILEEDMFYKYLSLGIYNLMFTTDPDRIILGGAITKHQPLVGKLNEYIDKRLVEHGIHIEYEITLCDFLDEANLVGAVYAFKLQEEILSNTR